jgi:FkbM family methyltransferase
MDTLVSYAQNREDLYLWALLGHVKNGFYVDVGANHPELHSVTKLFYDRGWRGMNIEPNPELYKTFLGTRKKDINVNVGVADKESTLTFRNYPHHNGLSTFSEPIMRLHEEENLPFEDSKVKVIPISRLLKKHKVPHIDFMKIDVEGFEVEVMNGNNWDKYRPKVLCIEATVRHEVAPITERLGYRLEFFDGLNNYYVDTKRGDEITIYNYAPRVLVKAHGTSREAALESKVAELEATLAEKENQRRDLENELLNMRRFKSQPRNVINASKHLAQRYADKLSNQ